ncbi:MAG TPA: hypothetical protein VMM76_21295 [Pirellulaceae bacterium]|nr:hypothetical protein [Pirellulaceae bacterium]
MKRLLTALFLGVVTASPGTVTAVDSETTPRPVPLTRPEMKQYLEDMKARKPRIPLPELTEEDKANLGERASSYESRLRYHYMPSRDGEQRTGGRSSSGGFGRENDPEMSLTYAFKTELFWIVSRTNNCQYCLGHQESKLLGAGLTEDQIAALDCDWSVFSPEEQTAFAFARKITYEPHLVNDADIDQLRKHYTDRQILEMILSVAGNNSINRWKEGAGIPQSANGGGFGRRTPTGAEVAETADRLRVPETYLTPTAQQYKSVVTIVAPLLLDEKTGAPTRMTVSRRPALESRQEVEAALAAARQRTPRLPLVDEGQAKEVLPEDFPAGTLPQWVRLLATFPTSAPGRISSIRSAEQRGDLTPLLKAQASWIIARQDRAWYAAGEAKRRLQQLGWTDDQIYQLDGSWDEFTPTERALFTIARKLAATPIVLTDAEVDEAVKLAGPRDVVQLISYTTNRASFDRITEAAGLRIEE